MVRPGRTDKICTGTTNSAVAIMEGKVPKIIENAEGTLAALILILTLTLTRDDVADLSG